jgi:peptide chain release factor subunit 3
MKEESNLKHTCDVDQEERENYEELERLISSINVKDPRNHINILFIGHVDAGKSSLCGRIIYLAGRIDERTIQKYEKEAKDKNRESWYMAYIMDTGEEERAKGKTVDIGRANIVTNKKRCTILDAPGHKNFVPNMIQGATQADLGILVISARKGEFEAGFERGGQTREHAQLAKTLGVQKLVCVINKMDDTSISGDWDESRFKFIVARIRPFLKASGFQTKDIDFIPIAGLEGININERVPFETCGWWCGPCLLEAIDNISQISWSHIEALRLPISDHYKDTNTVVSGKNERGIIKVGDSITVMPNQVLVRVLQIFKDDDEVLASKAGENLRIKLQGLNEEVCSGHVLCSSWNPIPVVSVFEAQIAILDLLDHKSVFTAGYKCILHIHCLVEECEISRILHLLDTKSKEKKKANFAISGSIVVAKIAVSKPLCIEKFKKVPQMGRFTLRDEGKTIAIGKVNKLPVEKPFSHHI